MKLTFKDNDTANEVAGAIRNAGGMATLLTEVIVVSESIPASVEAYIRSIALRIEK